MPRKPDSPLHDSQSPDTPRPARRKIRFAGPEPANAVESPEPVAGNVQSSAPAPLSPAKPAELSVPKPEKPAEVRNHRELAEAIFSECDPVKIGRELLESSSDKGASVRARVFETLADWQFGKKPAPREQSQRRVHVIWTIPGPPRESETPEETEQPALPPEPPEND
jgi:hypothetical protein